MWTTVLTVISVGVVRASASAELASFVKANNHFAMDLLNHLPTQESHTFISPYSVSMAMAMLYHGARGQTAEELAHVLGYTASNLERHALMLAIEELIQKHGHRDQDVTLDVANALLVARNLPVLKKYREDVEEVFEALFEEVDFTDGNQLVRVNEWVAEQTRGKITNFLKVLPARTVMIILNAVYFKGKWNVPFDKTRTTKLPFYNRGVDPKPVDTMMQTGDHRFRHGYSSHLKAKVLELPYKGNEFSMAIVLPDERAGLSGLLEKLDSSSLQEVLDGLRSAKVRVHLPKFNLTSRYSLSKVLAEQGAGSIFQSSANFSGIFKSGGMPVSDVEHKAVFEVNEEGSEAAAATGVITKLSAPLMFRVDHPFLFFIRNVETNLILFLGVVNELSAK
ncbi:intracellular coagulation inhibitor 3-like [Ornithodoros turicata]|uniref:intracellular coagulation inhibitor 3-like n=1 Tax=Ornithodoros turicata TaxID=34597 RepID=UPI00313A0BB6